MMSQRLTRFEIIIYAIVLALVVIGVVLSFVNIEAFRERYAVEDGFIEWLTVGGFLVGGFVCLRRAWRLRSRRSLRFVGLTALLGLAFIFCAGEEISWGQRLFGVESSEFFLEHNAQGETNLHNLMIGEVKVNKLVFSKAIGVVLAIYFAVLTPLFGSKPPVRRFVNAHAHPDPEAPPADRDHRNVRAHAGAHPVPRTRARWRSSAPPSSSRSW